MSSRHEIAEIVTGFLSANLFRRKGQKEAELHFTRHGVFEAYLMGVLIKSHPEDLKRDIERYPNLTLLDVQIGTALHDAGKPHVAANPLVWLVPQRLSPREVQEMKKHPETGYLYAQVLEMYCNFGFPPVVFDIVRWHHEKLDGSGPEGLVGDQIPYIIQCITVVDQILSRCVEKPYQERRFKLSEAYRDVNRYRDIRYSPEVLDKVRHLLEQNAHLQEPGLKWLGEF